MGMRRLARLRSLGRRREGSTAVEFAMVALPFAIMMFSIIEIAFVFVLDSTLENAVIETGRRVRTGQASAAGYTVDTFKSSVCGKMSIFSTGCSARLTVDVRVIPQFNNPTLPDPMSGSSFNASGLTYNNGQPGDLMLVRAWYKHTLFTPFLRQGLARLGGDDAYLTAATAFRTEPWNG